MYSSNYLFHMKVKKQPTLNKLIFETIYFAALEASMEIAKDRKGLTQLLKDHHLSEGKFQFDLWNVKPSNMWDWDKS